MVLIQESKNLCPINEDEEEEEMEEVEEMGEVEEENRDQVNCDEEDGGDDTAQAWKSDRGARS